MTEEQEEKKEEKEKSINKLIGPADDEDMPTVDEMAGSPSEAISDIIGLGEGKELEMNTVVGLSEGSKSARKKKRNRRRTNIPRSRKYPRVSPTATPIHQSVQHIDS